jgi:hypothetical protein
LTCGCRALGRKRFVSNRAFLGFLSYGGKSYARVGDALMSPRKGGIDTDVPYKVHVIS